METWATDGPCTEPSYAQHLIPPGSSFCFPDVFHNLANPLVNSTKEMVIKVYILRLRTESIRMGKNKGKIWGGNQLKKKKLLCHTLMVWFKKSGQNTRIPAGPRENVLRTHASWPEGFVWSFMWLFIVGIVIVFNITLSFNLFLKSFLLWFLNRLKFQEQF